MLSRRIGAGVFLALLVALVWWKLGAVEQAAGRLLRLPSPSWPWIGVAVAAIATSFVLSAVALCAAVGARLRLGRTVGAQLAATAANRVTPGSVGGAAVNIRYLTRAGFAPGAAGAAVTVVGVAHVFIALLGVAAFGPGVAINAVRQFARRSPSPGWLAVASVMGAALVIVVFFIGWRLRRHHRYRALTARVRPMIADAVQSTRRLSRHPGRLATLVGGVAAVKAANLLALYAALWAFDGDVRAWRVAVAYLVGATTAELIPTPGGLGAVDAALLLALVGTTTGAGGALAGVLLYRFLAFWAPIAPGLVSSAVLRRGMAL